MFQSSLCVAIQLELSSVNSWWNGWQDLRQVGGEDAILSTRRVKPLGRRRRTILGTCGTAQELRMVDAVGRMFLCAHCLEQIVLRGRCDRDRRYCDQICSSAACCNHSRVAAVDCGASLLGRLFCSLFVQSFRLDIDPSDGAKSVAGNRITGCDATRTRSHGSMFAFPLSSSIRRMCAECRRKYFRRPTGELMSGRTQNRNASATRT